MFIDAFGVSLESLPSQAISHSADDKIIDSGVCPAGHFDREKIKDMNCARIDRQFRAVAGSQPAHVHKQGIVDQRVKRSDGKQSRRHCGQIGIKRRNIRIEHIGTLHVVFMKPFDDFRIQNQISFAPAPGTGRQGQVICAVRQDRGAKSPETVPIAHPKQGYHRKIGAGRLPADNESVGAEFCPCTPPGRFCISRPEIHPDAPRYQA